MPLDGKNILEVNESDLASLIDSKKREGKDIDYKIKLISNSDGDKKEFLYDVCSFANASGGHLIIGMDEQDGLPVELKGVKNEGIETEVLRLENLIRDCIEPRISGVQIRSVSLMSGNIALVIRIPRSWAMPHMVSYQGTTKFYGRNSAGKYPLDISEIRTLFSLSDSVNEKIKNFRIERINQILAGDTPVHLPDATKIVLHLIPLTSLAISSNFEMSDLTKSVIMLCPLNSSGWNHRFNFDGYLTYSASFTNEISSYLQIRRSGIIEAVEVSMLKTREGQKTIPSILFEQAIIEGVERFLSIQKDLLHIEPPVIIQLSLLNVKGYIMSETLRHHLDLYPIERDILLLPEVLIEDYDQNVARTIKPIFDTVWNATGWSGSPYYDKNGSRSIR